MTNKYLTVSALNKYISYKFDNDVNLKRVFIKGEISNFRESKGHFYFVLKDNDSEISSIMFSSYNSKLQFTPLDGMTVLIMGSINVYQKKGIYNLTVYEMEEYGIGYLHLQFLKLKEQLEKEGLFKSEYKKSISVFNENIGVITSGTGDALHDIVSTISKRFPLSKVYLYPVLVQGEDAPRSLINAIKQANRDNLVDVIIIARGGGSIEDLSCFNDEMLAREIFNSKIPIVSGVGHEADVTICDLVADDRAPTPTGAAVKVTPDKSLLLQELNNLKGKTINYLKKILEFNYYSYQTITNSHYFKNFQEILNNKNRDLDNIIYSLKVNSPINLIKKNIEKINDLSLRLSILNLDKKIDNIYNDITKMNLTLNKYISNKIDQIENKIENIIDKLIISNPLNIMKKGYTLTYQGNNLIHNISEIDMHKDIKIKYTDGTVNAHILKIESEDKNGEI